MDDEEIGCDTCRLKEDIESEEITGQRDAHQAEVVQYQNRVIVHAPRPDGPQGIDGGEQV